MRAIRVHYGEGNYIETNINGTTSEINQYYLGQSFNVGDGAGGDLLVKAVRVEFLDEDSGMISIGDQVQSIETNWQGRVTGFDRMDGDYLDDTAEYRDDGETICCGLCGKTEIEQVDGEYVLIGETI